MPVDRTEEPSPLASWRFAQGIIYSRNEWTNQCTLLFHTSLKRNKIYPFIKVSLMCIMLIIFSDVSSFFSGGRGVITKKFLYNMKQKTNLFVQYIYFYN